MKLSSKRKSIKAPSNVLSRLLDQPLFLKFVLLVLFLGPIFFFKFWAERQREQFSPFPSSSPAMSEDLTEPAPAAPTRRELPLHPLDINAASLEELESLPAIGPKLAEAIIQDRSRNGPFRKMEDLLRVKGIGSKKLGQIASYIRFEEVNR